MCLTSRPRKIKNEEKRKEKKRKGRRKEKNL